MRDTRSPPQAAREMRPWNFLFFLLYAVQKSANHFEGLSKYPVRKVLKSPIEEGGLGLTPDKAGAFLADTALGWYVKALFGLLTDNLPIFGYRRKSWLIITSVLAGGAWLWVSVHGTTVEALLVALMMINVLIAFSDVVCDGLMVETAQRFERRFDLPSGTANRPFQASQWSGAMFAVFLASIGGGIIAQFLEFKTAATISGLAPLALAIAVAVIVKEEKVPWDWRKARKGFAAVGVIALAATVILRLKDTVAGSAWEPLVPVISTLIIIGCLLAMVRIPRALTAPLLLVFFWQALPFDTNAQFVYHYFTRHNTAFVSALAEGNVLLDALRAAVGWLGLSTVPETSGNFVELYWGSILGAVNALFGIVGAFFFRRYFTTIPFAHLFVGCLTAQGMVVFCFLSFPVMGVVSPWWLMGLMAIEGFVFIIAALALLGYAAKLTPEHNQASVFAFFMGMYNLGQVLGREHVGSRLYTAVAQGAPSAVDQATQVAIRDPNAGMIAVIFVALIYLGCVLLLVRHMIRRGYISHSGS